jgi:hypothetical protein
MNGMFATILLALGAAVAADSGGLFNFENDEIGKAPAGFTAAVTGPGAEGKWVVQEDATAKDGKKVLAQTSDDSTGNRFPVCVIDNISATNVEVAVDFKPVSGKVDQAAGIVWRYKDRDNYYLVRANALEDNVVLYKVQDGKRTDLKIKAGGSDYGVKTRVPSGQWGHLAVKAAGRLFTVECNGQKLFEVEDTTFTGAGKVGLWTKADSVTLFDNLKVVSNDK